MKNITKITLIGITALSVNLAFAESGEGKRDKKDRGEIFTKLDADQSGSLTFEELSNSKKFEDDVEKAEKVFEHIDADGDGSITEEEFLTAERPKKGKKGGRKDRSAE